MAKTVLQKYNGQIPNNEKELIKLAGVGQKTANVFMIEYYNKNLMAVDTHVFRVSHRLRMSDAKTISQTQKDLQKLLKEDLNIFHQGLVLFGRYICTAKNPKCNNCKLNNICQK
jgi:endonuclease-3